MISTNNTALGPLNAYSFNGFNDCSGAIQRMLKTSRKLHVNEQRSAPWNITYDPDMPLVFVYRRNPLSTWLWPQVYLQVW
jgi:hypothetical protein